MKKRMIKTEHVILLLIFLAVIALPGVLIFHDVGRYLPGDNRMAASFPKLIKDNGSFATRTELEGFVHDNIGFRTAAAGFDIRVMYSLFGIMLDRTQLRGKDSNFFSGDDRRFPTLRAPYPPLSEEELAENGRNIKAASDYFKSKDIPFIFLTIPNKEEVYPDLYPDTFVKRPDQNRLAQQVEWLGKNTGVDAYDLTEVLRAKALETDGMLWYEARDNAHWNHMGAWYGYLAIMERFRMYNPDLNVLSLDDFDVTMSREPYISWDDKFVYKDLFNTVYYFDYKPGFSFRPVSNTNDPWMPPEQLEIAGFAKGGVYFHYYNETLEGTLVLFGDSYIYQFLLPYFTESYRHVYLFHLPTNFAIMKPVLEMIGPDLVVLEMVERTYGMVNMDKMAEEFAAETPVLTRPEDYPD